MNTLTAPLLTQQVLATGTTFSHSIVKLVPALLAAQKAIKSVTKDASNPYFNSKYATLESVIDAVKKPLNDEEIVVLQPVGFDTEGGYVETILMHTSGEYISSRMRLVSGKGTMQDLGSAISYARRYSLQSVVFLGVADDDGEASMGRTTTSNVASLPKKPVEAKKVFKPAVKTADTDVANGSSDW